MQKSAGKWSVSMYLTSISYLTDRYLMKCSLMSMCLDRSEAYLWLFVVNSSYHLKIEVVYCWKPISLSRTLRITASWADSVNKMYSDSVELRATVLCFALFQLSQHWLIMKGLPEVDFLSSTQLAKSES